MTGINRKTEAQLKAAGKGVRKALQRAKAHLEATQTELTTAAGMLEEQLKETSVQGPIRALFWVVGEQVKLVLDSVAWLAGTKDKGKRKRK